MVVIPPLRSRPRLNRGRRQPAARRDPLIRGRHGHSFAASRTILRGPWPERRGSRAVRPQKADPAREKRPRRQPPHVPEHPQRRTTTLHTASAGSSGPSAPRGGVGVVEDGADDGVAPQGRSA